MPKNPFDPYVLYAITTDTPNRNRTHIEIARAALAGGASVIQFREKHGTTRELLATAYEIRTLNRQENAVFIVNDRLDIALAAEADGVHLGDDDLPIPMARKIAGSDLLIGASVSTAQDAQAAVAAGADHLGVGCIFPTSSKNDAGPALGPDIIREIKSAVSVPIIAIGGITKENATAVLEAGADGIAVISAISNAENMITATQELKILFEKLNFKPRI